MVEKSELEDFCQVIRKHRRNVDEFELFETPDPPLSKELDAVKGSVTIKSKLSGRARTYRTGHGTAWVVEFDGDLAGGKL